MSKNTLAITNSPLSAYLYSPAEKKRGLFIALVDNFLMNCGFFMVIRLISLHYVEQLGWTAASIGLVLAIRQLLQQGMNPISGMIADHIGPKRLVCAGLGLRVVSFACMAWATTFPLLLLSAILTGLAGSLFDSPLAATIAALTEPHERTRFYSLYSVTSELGIVIGVQLGVVLLTLSFSFMALGAAICFLIASVSSILFLPPIHIERTKTRVTAGIRLALRDARFMTYTGLLMGFWFMWVQLTISLPLAVKGLGGTEATLGLVYALNSGITELLGYPLLRLAERRFSSFQILITGMVLMALGFGSIAFVHTIPFLIGSVVLVTLGTLLAMPSQKTVAAKLAHPVWLGTFLGVNSLALAFGGALGNLTGGELYDLARHLHQSALPWLVFGLVGLLAASGLVLLSRQKDAK